MEETPIVEVTGSSQAEIPTPAYINSRTDLATAAIVEEGLRLLSIHGFEHASEYLSAQMVPLRVAQRVLLRPSERRKADV